MCSTLHSVLAGKLFYIRLLAGKKFADLGLLVFKSIISDENLRVKRTKEEKMKHLMTFHFAHVINCWLGKKLIKILLGEIFRDYSAGKWTLKNAFLGSVQHLYVCQQRGKC